MRSAHSTWEDGPLHPRLENGQLHVWRADLRTIADELSELLSADEHARAERILDERRRQLWQRSRAVLRVLLGRYLDSDPSALGFVLSPAGKPALIDSGLSFNLSHSGDLALYAIYAAGAVGVDIEIHRSIDAVAVAKHFLGEEEARRLAGLDSTTREREFFQAWVRHEAKLKCLGTGIGGVPVEDPQAQTHHDPHVVDLESAGAAAAVASDPPALELHRWDWRS